MHGGRHASQEGVHGRGGACMVGGRAWPGVCGGGMHVGGHVCMVGGGDMHGRGACMVGGMHDMHPPWADTMATPYGQ